MIYMGWLCVLSEVQSAVSADGVMTLLLLRVSKKIPRFYLSDDIIHPIKSFGLGMTIGPPPDGRQENIFPRVLGTDDYSLF